MRKRLGRLCAAALVAASLVGAPVSATSPPVPAKAAGGGAEACGLDSVPRDAHERAAVAYLCGYGPDGGERLVEDYLRSTRRASAVIDRVFWT